MGQVTLYVTGFTNALHFAPMIQDKQVFVGTNNHTTTADINRQGGVYSTALLKLAQNLQHWALEHLLSLRALHVPGVENMDADLMSSDGSLLDWTSVGLTPKQVWIRFRRSEMNLFATHSNTHYPLWFSLALHNNPHLGVDVVAHAPWLSELLYIFLALHLISSQSKRVRLE